MLHERVPFIPKLIFRHSNSSGEFREHDKFEINEGFPEVLAILPGSLQPWNSSTIRRRLFLRNFQWCNQKIREAKSKRNIYFPAMSLSWLYTMRLYISYILCVITEEKGKRGWSELSFLLRNSFLFLRCFVGKRDCYENKVINFFTSSYSAFFRLTVLFPVNLFHRTKRNEKGFQVTALNC